MRSLYPYMLPVFMVKSDLFALIICVFDPVLLIVRQLEND